MHANYINRQRIAACIAFLVCVGAIALFAVDFAGRRSQLVEDDSGIGDDFVTDADSPDSNNDNGQEPETNSEQESEAKPPVFINAKIEEPYKTHLLKNPLLMEIPGAKVIKLLSGKTLIVGVASTTIGDKSLVNADVVLRAKADGQIIMLTGAVLVAVEEVIDDVTVITTENGKETGKFVEEYRLKIKSTIKQSGKRLPVVGRWNSPDGESLFYAVGIIIDPAK